MSLMAKDRTGYKKQEETGVCGEDGEGTGYWVEGWEFCGGKKTAEELAIGARGGVFVEEIAEGQSIRTRGGNSFVEGEKSEDGEGGYKQN